MLPPPQHITILGGGLTGLSSAFHLSRRFPSTRVTLLEKQNRLGGWVRSEQVRVRDDPAHKTASGSPSVELTIEAGPRTLRPTSKALLELINLLNLQSALLTTPRTAPAARSRFIYSPSLQPGLIALPSSPLSLLRPPIRQILLPAILREPFRKSNRTSSHLEGTNYPPLYDETLDSFLSRRFGSEVARLLGSALCHGVYAADARDLSLRATFPSLLKLEDLGKGSVLRGIVRDILAKREAEEKYDLGNVKGLMRGIALYSFRGGMQTLSDALIRKLQTYPNVELCPREPIKGIELLEDEDSSLAIHTAKRTLNPTHIVSALPLPHLQSILPPPSSHAHQLPHLTSNPASSVTVITLIFATPPSTIHPPGFGYLVPRPPNGYPEQDDTSALGVLGTVFDSCALPGSSEEANYTKLTVMLGGPYRTPIPSDDDLLRTRVLAHLKEALQRPLPPPVVSRVWRHVDCIPRLRVGHVSRMEELNTVLKEQHGSGAWRGRMEVIGAGVGGVSVGDCVEAGRTVGLHW